MQARAAQAPSESEPPTYSYRKLDFVKTLSLAVLAVVLLFVFAREYDRAAPPTQQELAISKQSGNVPSAVLHAQANERYRNFMQLGIFPILIACVILGVIFSLKNLQRFQFDEDILRRWNAFGRERKLSLDRKTTTFRYDKIWNRIIVKDDAQNGLKVSIFRNLPEFAQVETMLRKKAQEVS